ncbi:MAG: membrane receptor RagA [Thalassobius sp.]|nr:membrane receptor RagA [Thalassovita sp.]
MKYLFLLSILVFSVTLTNAQGIKGKVTDSEGAPLPFTTIYIKQLETGTSTNMEGEYQFKLKPGTYDVLYQYLGYEAVQKKVEIASDFQVIDVTMQTQIIELKEVLIKSNKEDPAYAIMRKAIAKSKFHTLQVDAYSCRVYVKGSGRLKDYPFFLRKAIEDEGIDTTTTFTSESISEVSYERPNTVKEKVISVRKNGDDNSTSPNGYITGSFYEPKIVSAISPLSPRAFAYYRFEYVGTFRDRDYDINKIKVIPRSKGDDVFAGYIFIVDDLWSIHSLSLKTYKQGILFHIDQIYGPIEEKVWLPLSHKFDVTGKIFGIEFEYKYLATVSDYEITLNPDLEDTEIEVIDEKTEKELVAALAKEEELSKRVEEEPDVALKEQKKFTRKELKKVLNDYEKQLDEAESKMDTMNVEIVSNYSMTIDSLAGKDESYWQEVRPVPLTEMEKKSYEKLDSIAVAEETAAKDTTSTGDKRKSKRKGNFHPEDILLGTTFKLSDKTRLEYKSPLTTVNFNTVEGYVFEVPLELRTRFENYKRLNFEARGRYSFAREKVNGKLTGTYQYKRKAEEGQLVIEGGRYINQLNEEQPIHPIINAFSTLLWERNYMKIFEKDYVKATHFQKIKEGLVIKYGVEWARRYQLFNNTDHVYFDKDNRVYTPNNPPNFDLLDTSFPEHEAFIFHTDLEYLPFLKYVMRNGKRRLIPNSSPLFRLSYRKGINDVFGSDVDYDLLEVGFKHRVKIGVRGRLDVNAFAGKFLNNNSLSFIDFKHFPGNQTVLQTSDPVNSYRLLDYYYYSTQDQYVGSTMFYQFRKFLLTQIFEVRLAGLKENILFNYLKTDASPHYMEVGYSLDNIFRFFRVEAIASFEDMEYKDFGIRIGISTNIGELFDIN